jgi:hypothetical protein
MVLFILEKPWARQRAEQGNAVEDEPAGDPSSDADDISAEARDSQSDEAELDDASEEGFVQDEI